MTAWSFVTRATIETSAVVVVLAVLAAGVGGPSAGLGILAGGVLAVANLWWLARRLVTASAGTPAGWPLGAMVRLAAAGAAIAVILATGLAHPVGVVAGLTVLPCVLVVRGLAAAREA